MNYVDKLNFFGVEAMQNPCIKGEGAPTTSTEAAVGFFYMDTLTGEVYKCVAVNNGVYAWEVFNQSSGGNGNQSGGLSATASALLISILRNAVYGSDQSANITALENALASSGNGGDDSGGEENPGVVTYTVTNNLTNVVTSNSATSVAENTAFATILTAVEGYTLGAVTVTMGGVDITDSVYSSGSVTIPAVTGDIVITAGATAEAVNLYDKETMYIDGKYYKADGTLGTGADYGTAMIPLDGGKTYRMGSGSDFVLRTSYIYLYPVDGSTAYCWRSPYTGWTLNNTYVNDESLTITPIDTDDLSTATEVEFTTTADFKSLSLWLKSSKFNISETFWIMEVA